MASSNKIINITTHHAMDIKYVVDILYEFLPEASFWIVCENDDYNCNEDVLALNSETDGKKPKKSKAKTKKEEPTKKGSNYIKISAADPLKSLIVYVKLYIDKLIGVENGKDGNFYAKYPKFPITLDMTELHEFTRTIDGSSILNISVSTDSANIAQFELINDETDTSIEYRQGILREQKEQPLQTIKDFEFVIKMKSDAYKFVCQHLSKFQYIDIRCTESEIIFTGKTITAKSLSIKYKNGDKKDSKVTITRNPDSNFESAITQGIFSIKSLQAFSKCSNVCEHVTLTMKNDFPLFLQFSIRIVGTMTVGFAPVTDKNLNVDPYDASLYPAEEPIMKE